MAAETDSEKVERYRTALLSYGACPACIDGAADTFGCWDCQNTGYSGGDPQEKIKDLEAKNSLLKQALTIAKPAVEHAAHAYIADANGAIVQPTWVKMAIGRLEVVNTALKEL